MVRVPIVQGEHRLADANTQLGEVVVEDLPPSPSGSPVELTFRLDLSGVLHVTAQHLSSGTSANVVIANSPYQLTAQRRSAARAEVEELREGATEGHAEEHATETDLSLARAMLTRARKAVERGSDDAAALERAKGAIGALEAATARRSPDVAALTDALSDALLDLL